MSRKIIIIGGGASGVLLACHLLRDGGRDVAITVIEKRAKLGLGTAYSTKDPGHLLNVRASNMSAFADNPMHFQRWLIANTVLAREDSAAATTFAPRRLYGQYINSLIQAFDRDSTRLQVINKHAVAVRQSVEGVVVELDDGQLIEGRCAVLATGFDEPKQSNPAVRSPWSDHALNGLSPTDPVAILGTGLTMVDTVVTLRSRGHRGRIYAISRRGLLPHTHRPARPMTIAPSEIPKAARMTLLVRWLRGVAERSVLESGDWRSAVDAIRPYTSPIWQSLSLDAKRRFLRHARPWWDIHRHRMAPSIAAEINAARVTGQLQIIAANVTAITAAERGAQIVYRARGSNVFQTVDVACIFSCMGVSTNPATASNPAIASLVSQGLARPDSLDLGLDIAPNNALRCLNGEVSDQIFAIGPITRGAYWEMIAVPDIRQQCAALSTELIARARACKWSRIVVAS